jgi:hypothetical protein
MADQKRGTFIHGIAASEHLDSSGERIKVDGVDISSLTKDGVFNYEHNSKEASSIVGKILEAKKILKRSDCDTDHQKYFWDKIKMPYIYVAGELFDGVGHKEAGEVAAMVRYDQQEPINKEAKKLINFSIEGSRMEKQGAVITKCIARKISITLTPCNKVCEAEELKMDPKEEKHSDSGKFAFIQDVMSKADEPSCQIMKGEIPFLYKAAPAIPAPKMSAAPKAPAAPKTPKTTIARPDKGFGAIIDKTPKQPSKPNYGKVIIKGKKTPVKMTAEQAVDEHEKLVDVLESPSHKDDKKEAKKQRKELKEYKEKLDKAERKPVNPKDPVLNYGKFGPKAMNSDQRKKYEERAKALAEKTKVGKKEDKGVLAKPYVSDAQRRWAHTPKGKEALGGAKAVAHWDKASKGKKLPERKKKKLSKYDSNVRKALTASCGLGASPATKVQGDAVAKAEWPQYKKPPEHPKFFENHKGTIPKSHPDYQRAVDHITSVHNSGRRAEARRLHDRYITGGGSYVKKSEIDDRIFYLAKASWNVREQRKKVFGTKSQPAKGSEMREKHLAHIKNFVDKFLGLDLQPSGGKIDPKTGERRDDNPKIGEDKPDWRSGNFESQWNPEAAIHEIAHVMLLPKGIGLEEGQRWMDKNFAESNKKYGWQQGKYTEHEVQPMAAEQLIRRFIGLPASQVSVPVESKDAPPRMAVDNPKEVIGTRVKQGKTRTGEEKWVDLIRQARFLHPEHRERLEQIFTGKLKFDPDRGWIPKKSLDAAITNRQPGAVIARQQKRQAQAPAPQSQELPPNVVRMKQRPAPAASAPSDTQDQVNPPEMAQPKMKIAKSEINKAMKKLGDEAFQRFEKKEELVKFLTEKLPNLSNKEILALAKAVAYTSEKKKELALASLLEKENG